MKVNLNKYVNENNTKQSSRLVNNTILNTHTTNIATIESIAGMKIKHTTKYSKTISAILSKRRHENNENVDAKRSCLHVETFHLTILDEFCEIFAQRTRIVKLDKNFEAYWQVTIFDLALTDELIIFVKV